MNKLAKWTGIFFVVLLVNTAYVASFPTATIFYMTNVLFHLGLGLALAVSAGILLARNANFRRDMKLAAPILLVSVAFALYLVARGNITEHRWAFWAHIGTAALGVLLLLPFLRRQSARYRGGWASLERAVLS